MSLPPQFPKETPVALGGTSLSITFFTGVSGAHE